MIAGESPVAHFVPRKVDSIIEPFPELVEELEKLLAQAKSGHLRAAAWATVTTDGVEPDAEVATGWAMDARTNFALSAAVARLQHRWDECEHSGR